MIERQAQSASYIQSTKYPIRNLGIALQPLRRGCWYALHTSYFPFHPRHKREQHFPAASALGLSSNASTEWLWERHMLLLTLGHKIPPHHVLGHWVGDEKSWMCSALLSSAAFAQLELRPFPCLAPAVEEECQHTALSRHVLLPRPSPLQWVLQKTALNWRMSVFKEFHYSQTGIWSL